MNSEEEIPRERSPRLLQNAHFLNGVPDGMYISGHFRLLLPFFWWKCPPEQLHLHYRNMFQISHFMNVQHETTFESNRLYEAHLRWESNRNGLPIPMCLLFGFRPPNNMQTLFTLTEQFRASPQRRWVFEHANAVALESLNFQTFRAMLSGLFLDGGVTWERVLVLFFFCSDLTLRALREKLDSCFYRIHNWCLGYMSLIFSYWIEQRGGWEAVLTQGIRSTNYKAELVATTLSCVGTLALFTLIKMMG